MGMSGLYKDDTSLAVSLFYVWTCVTPFHTKGRIQDSSRGCREMLVNKTATPARAYTRHPKIRQCLMQCHKKTKWELLRLVAHDGMFPWVVYGDTDWILVNLAACCLIGNSLIFWWEGWMNTQAQNSQFQCESSLLQTSKTIYQAIRHRSNNNNFQVLSGTLN